MMSCKLIDEAAVLIRYVVDTIIAFLWKLHDVIIIRRTGVPGWIFNRSYA